MNLPKEKNPFDIQNMVSIPLLKVWGYEGVDVNLSTSLFEYDLIWRRFKKTDFPEAFKEYDGDEFYIFIYPIPSIIKGGTTHFDRCALRADLDVLTEFNWVNIEDIEGFSGQTKEEWVKKELPFKIHDLILYYGSASILGLTGWKGFQIAKE